jgi:soluble lytic murein transglycosylase-like protein
MTTHRILKTLLLIATIACLVWLFVAYGEAQASSGACSAKQAHRAAVQAAKQAREAQRVYRATKVYSARYGKNVGRWVTLARRAGYSWYEFPTLMRVIDRESGGNPAIPNSCGSGALGLLQVMPEWAEGSKSDYWRQWHLSARWNRTNARETLRHCVHMAWSNWGE